ncbi:hypothetical protein H4V95_000281 [Arthrobacter sp. CAN_C5]|nr:hypothetical protein [Arthrobacter sp. CAN_C5]
MFRRPPLILTGAISAGHAWIPDRHRPIHNTLLIPDAPRKDHYDGK